MLLYKLYKIYISISRYFVPVGTYASYFDALCVRYEGQCSASVPALDCIFCTTIKNIFYISQFPFYLCIFSHNFAKKPTIFSKQKSSPFFAFFASGLSFFCSIIQLFVNNLGLLLLLFLLDFLRYETNLTPAHPFPLRTESYS